MKNVEMRVEGNVLHITVDLDKNFGPSASGKTVIIATTKGNQELPGRPGIKVGLNVYKVK
jgi:hypothetical protein